MAVAVSRGRGSLRGCLVGGGVWSGRVSTPGGVSGLGGVCSGGGVSGLEGGVCSRGCLFQGVSGLGGVCSRGCLLRGCLVWGGCLPQGGGGRWYPSMH